jgi:hypothetical protein
MTNDKGQGQRTSDVGLTIKTIFIALHFMLSARATRATRRAKPCLKKMVTGVEFFRAKFFLEKPLFSVASHFFARIFRPAHFGGRPYVMGKALVEAFGVVRWQGRAVPAGSRNQLIHGWQLIQLRGFSGLQVLSGLFVCGRR